MHMNIYLRLLPLIALIFTATTTLHARVWTLTDQRTFEADYVSATATHVSLKVRDGRTVPVELARLSQADRDFIAQQLAATPALPAATTTVMPFAQARMTAWLSGSAQ